MLIVSLYFFSSQFRTVSLVIYIETYFNIRKSKVEVKYKK